ncbi:MAG: DUF3426 domain-containing protein [Steroidobacterales bacterium]
MTGVACTRAAAMFLVRAGPDMFTQCPQCETVFRLSADVLGAAGGQVRCGRCGEVFDSLQRLAEEPRMFAIGESTLELEARAEHILESSEEAPNPQAEAPVEPLEEVPGEFASLEILEVQTEDRWQQVPDLDARDPDAPAPEFAEQVDRSLEFSLTPTELDRIFIEANPDEPLPEDAGEAEGPAQAESVVAEDPHATAVEPQSGQPPDVAQILLAPATSRAYRRQRLLWIVAGILLGLLLAAQVVHRNREWLASREPLGAALRALYAGLGSPLPVPASLSGYQLRQWGASGDTTASGALRVRASILNTTAQLQPFPLLRVTLADRFGAHIGSRDFEPAEYLGKPVTRLLGPGERADATVEIQDPGESAEGFELDVCLRAADGRVRCAGDAAPQPR